MKKTTPANEQSLSLVESEIFHAIRHCHYKQLALYLRHNYNLCITSKDGRNGLFYALDIDDGYKRCRMLRYCLEHGMSPLQKEKVHGYTVLQDIISRQQVDSFEVILPEVSGEINWRSFDVYGRTILHQAVETNNMAILEALINITNRYSISVDVFDKNGLTPYLLAKKLHLHNMADILLKKGHASQLKSDSKTYRSAREWEHLGFKENRLHLRRNLRQEINDAKRKGKINKVNKLNEIYYSNSSLSTYERKRRDSYLTTTTRSGMNTKSSLSINEMIDRLSEGDRPESYLNSSRDEDTLPPLALGRRGPRSSFNSLIDLFQIVQLSS